MNKAVQEAKKSAFRKIKNGLLYICTECLFECHMQTSHNDPLQAARLSVTLGFPVAVKRMGLAGCTIQGALMGELSKPER